jgi:hypothetical protein
MGASGGLIVLAVRPFSRRRTADKSGPNPGQAGSVRMGLLPNDHNPPAGISTRLVSLSAVSADPPRLNDYDSFAEAYTAGNETSLINAYYNRPAILALAGDVTGRQGQGLRR